MSTIGINTLRSAPSSQEFLSVAHVCSSTFVLLKKTRQARMGTTSTAYASAFRSKICALVTLQLAMLFLLAHTRFGGSGTSEIPMCTETMSASICCNVETASSSNKSASRHNAGTASIKQNWRSSSLHYPTIKCGKTSVQELQCNVQNVYGEWPDRRKCLAALVVFPTNEAELVAAVAGAVRRRQSIKVATATGHSIPQWACARGSKGLIISTQNLNRRIDVDQSAMRVSVDGGVQLRELVDTLARAGLALRHSPYWDAITVGGLLSTGSHGSSLFGKGAAVQDYVVAMRLVVAAPPEQGYAQVVQLSLQDPFLLQAARVSLGLLGVISQVGRVLHEVKFDLYTGGVERMVSCYGSTSVGIRGSARFGMGSH